MYKEKSSPSPLSLFGNLRPRLHKLVVMELIERGDFLLLMKKEYEKASHGEGHSIIIYGESGIGKTSLVKAFCKTVKEKSKIYKGSCDALFTPRPLGPFFDILWQMKKGGAENPMNNLERSALFTRFYHELSNQPGTAIIVIEDIHWADEATLDFIKFFSRRITDLECLFILTYRDNEIHTQHPLRMVLGQLPPDSFTRLQLTTLSREAVEKMAEKKGYKGEDIYSISGGNPFYVNEILANYSTGIPDNIRDSILSVYNSKGEKTRELWQLLSVIPTGFEIKYLEKMDPSYITVIHNCLDSKIFVASRGLVSFKHELYRRTIESSLSPIFRIELNKKILELLLSHSDKELVIERIIHHAKNANEFEVIVKYAPLAARQAAFMGAHIEAARLYLSAIEYYQENDKQLLIQFYQAYAYECYLTNQIKEAIIYSEKSLHILKEKKDIEQTANCMRFLSRLWWFDGNRKKAETYASQAIEYMVSQSNSKAKAMAFSNMSQLKMLSDQRPECIFWGEKAIEMARELSDEEALSHALNNVGSVQMRVQSSRQEGIELLEQSLEIALRNSYEEHAARAYINLANNAVEMRDHEFAKKILEDGIHYCEKRDLDIGKSYLLSSKARLTLESGNWSEADRISDRLLKDENNSPIVRIGALVVGALIRIRKGETDEALPLLLEAKEKAFETMEQHRIIPVIVALLEYEWLTATTVIEQADLDHAIEKIHQADNVYQNSEFAFWLYKARKQRLSLPEFHEGYQVENHKMAQRAAKLWKQLGCPFELALVLFEGTDADKKEAVAIVHKLGAKAVYEKMKSQLRALGVKGIPRGIRKSTFSNPANLTTREVDVLQLLSEGLPNKKIAARLFISPKTVDHHVTSIFFKLDVNSRSQAIKEALNLNIIK